MIGDRSTVYAAVSGGTGWLQRLIKWGSKSDVNHAFFVLYDQDFGGWVQLGADEGGWVQSPAETRLKLPVCRLYAAPPGIDLRVGLAAMRSVLGAKYDIGGLVGMAWVVLMRRVGRKVKNPLQRGNKWFCNEIADVVCERSGWDLGLDEHSTTPGDWEKALRSHGAIGPVDLAAVISTPTATAA
jgi:hypothetical protein